MQQHASINHYHNQCLLYEADRLLEVWQESASVCYAQWPFTMFLAAAGPAGRSSVWMTTSKMGMVLTVSTQTGLQGRRMCSCLLVQGAIPDTGFIYQRSNPRPCVATAMT